MPIFLYIDSRNTGREKISRGDLSFSRVTSLSESLEDADIIVQRSLSSGIFRGPLPIPFLPVLAQVLGEPSPAPTLRCLHCSEQGRAGLTRASLGKHPCLPDVYNVSRGRNQPRRARLVLQTLTDEEPRTAEAGG